MDNPDKLAIKGRARRRDSTWALERAQRAVRELPGNPFRYSGDGGSLSYILAQIGRFEEAITPARKAVEFEPGNPFLQEQLGFMLTNAGKLDKGEQAICQAIVIDPEIARFNGALGDNLMGQRRVLATIAAFRDVARFEPDDPRVIRRLACATVGAERVADAEPLLQSATEALPDMVDVHDLLSAVPEIQGRRAKPRRLRGARRSCSWTTSVGAIASHGS
jgi:Flp pilus assembly protein TadD